MASQDIQIIYGLEIELPQLPIKYTPISINSIPIIPIILIGDPKNMYENIKENRHVVLINPTV